MPCQTNPPYQDPPLAVRRRAGQIFTIRCSESPEHPLQDPSIPVEFLGWHPRYDLGAPGQERRSRSETEELLERRFADPQRVTLPAHCYEHGGIMLRNEPYGSPWDGSAIGGISVRKKDLRQAFGPKVKAAALQARGEDYLREVTRAYGRYLNGDSEYMIAEEPECPACGQADPRERRIYIWPAEDSSPEEILERHIREQFPEPAELATAA